MYILKNYIWGALLNELGTRTRMPRANRTVKSDPEAPTACVAMRRDAPRGTVSLIKYIISKFP